MGHACSTIGRKVVIGGGSYGPALSSVEIFDLDTKRLRPGGDLRTARAFFHLATVGEGAGQRVLAFGGGDNCQYSGSGFICESHYASVEEWGPARGAWRTQDLALATPRSSYSSVVLPPSLHCQGDLPTIGHGAVDCPDSRGVGTTCDVTCTTENYRLDTTSSGLETTSSGLSTTSSGLESTVVCGWGSAWITRARCGQFSSPLVTIAWCSLAHLTICTMSAQYKGLLN